MLYGMARRYDELRGEAPDGGSSLRGALKGWFKHGVCRAGALAEPGRARSRRASMTGGTTGSAGRWARTTGSIRAPWSTCRSRSTKPACCSRARSRTTAGTTGTRARAAGKRRPTGIWTIPYPWKAGPDDGHAFAIVGYDEDGFIVQNSWGNDWGTQGLAILTYEDWIKHGYDCWVAQLGVVTRRHEAQATGRARVSGARFGASGSTLLDLHALSPYVVNTGHNGELSPAGEFHTTYQDLEELANHLLPAKRAEWSIPPGAPIDVAIYAHGGLVDEQGAGESAQEWVKLFTDAKVFPIYLIWESDLLSILSDRVQNELKNRGGIPTGGLVNMLDDAWSDRVEGIVRVVGKSVWQDMKDKGRLITYNTAGRGGGMQLMELLAPQKATIRLHLVGHSAGAIVHAYLADWLVTQGWNIASASFLAPAATIELFDSRIQPHLQSGRLGRYAQFHLQDALERAEGGAMRMLLGYKRSLLYLISNALEEQAARARTRHGEILRHDRCAAQPAAPPISRRALVARHGRNEARQRRRRRQDAGVRAGAHPGQADSGAVSVAPERQARRAQPPSILPSCSFRALGTKPRRSRASRTPVLCTPFGVLSASSSRFTWSSWYRVRPTLCTVTSTEIARGASKWLLGGDNHLGRSYCLTRKCYSGVVVVRLVFPEFKLCDFMKRSCWRRHEVPGFAASRK